MAHASGGTGSRSLLYAALILLIIGVLVLLFLLWGAGREPTQLPGDNGPTEAPESTLLDQRVTVAVLGIDLDQARRGREETPNADTIVLASINDDQSQLVLVSLPRDTVDIPLPGGGLWERKANAMYHDEGPEFLVGALEALFGVEIDGYLALDMDDFAALVDAVSGIEVEVDQPLSDPIVALDLETGTHELDGAEALAFVRTRVDDDYGRADRNQQALLALLERFAEREGELDVVSVLDGLESFETNLPLDELPALVELVGRAAAAQVTREVLGPPRFITFEGDAGDGRGYVLVPDSDAIRDFVSDLLAD